MGILKGNHFLETDFFFRCFLFIPFQLLRLGLNHHGIGCLEFHEKFNGGERERKERGWLLLYLGDGDKDAWCVL